MLFTRRVSGYSPDVALKDLAFLQPGMILAPTGPMIHP